MGNIGLAQINLVAGGLEENTNKILEYIEKAKNLNLDIIVFPKHSLLGCELNDFINRYPFILNNIDKYLNIIKEVTENITVIVGFIDKNKKHVYAIIRNKQIEHILDNTEFITSKLINDGVEFLIHPTSLPSKLNSESIRHEFLEKYSRENKRVILDINQVGAIDCYSYNGESCAYDENGKLFARACAFEEELLVVDTYNKIGTISISHIPEMQLDFSLNYEEDLERTYKSIVQAIQDYFKKCGLKRAVLGLSGGLDSTVCAVLLVDALGKENVYGVSMPSKLTSIESKSDALLLAENLGIGFSETPIKEMHDTTTSCFEKLFEQVEQNWGCRYKTSYTQDNIQARSRAMYLWGISNEFESCIPIATSDKSELYMGYATINGDMSGGFAPIADVCKTKLFALARWINKNRVPYNVIPETIIQKRPGAELAINPATGKTLLAEEALMPYEFLDEIIWRIENKHQSYQELLKETFLYETKYQLAKEQKVEWLKKFYRRMSAALYKSYIMPPYVIVDSETINKSVYYQPITSGKIDYLN